MRPSSTAVLGLTAVLATAAVVGCHRAPSSDAGGEGADGGGPATPGTMAVARVDGGAAVAAADGGVSSPIPPELVAAVVNPSHLPVYAGPTGSVEGTILVKGPDAPAVDRQFPKCPAAKATHGKLFRAAAVDPANPDAPRALEGAVVAVTGYDTFVKEPHDVRLVVVDDCAETPSTITMTYGQRLDVANKTTVLFAPVLDQAAPPAVMLAPPGGDAVRIYAPKPGHYTFSDRLGGGFFAGDLYVLLHPLHAASDVKGHYRIDGIPLGKLTVNARLQAISQETSAPVEILAGVVQKVDLTIPYVPKTATSTQAAAPASTKPVPR